MTHDWTLLIDHCFDSTLYMTLATQGPDGPWTSQQYFSWDEKFNLYFISKMDAAHVQHLLENPAVACSIFATNQDTMGRILGATATGTAKHVTGTDDHAKADQVYFDRLHPNDPDAKEINGYRTNPAWHLFKITLTGLWYFDTDHFGENRATVPESIWK